MAQCIAILAPLGRDAQVIAGILKGACIDCMIQGSADDVVHALDGGSAGALILAEEALVESGLVRIRGWLTRQPLWSDLPIVLLSTKHGSDTQPSHLAERLGNVTILERPLHAATLISAARAALRARARQREAEMHIAELAARETELRQERTALEASEAALRDLNETLEQRVASAIAERDRIWRIAPDLMGVIRLDGTYLSVNPAWEQVLGWDPERLTGRNVAEIRHPDDTERIAAGYRQLATGQPVFGFEARYRHKDGGWRWISWTVRPESDLLYAIGRDITAEKETRAALEAAEAARREADALYRAYFETTAEALFVIRVEPDGGFIIEQVNPAHQTQLGFRQKEVAGKRIDAVLPPALAEQVIAAYRNVIETGEIIEYREAFDLPGGTQHWDNALVPIRDAEGRIARIFGSSRNVTAQVRAEETLRQAQKMEAVGQLTGGIAHDFNNLLGALVGSLDLIRRKPDDVERVRRFAEAGIQAAERGARLTGQLLAFSRAQRIEQKPVIVSNMVQGMHDLLSRSLGPMIRLSLDLDGDGAVLSDSTQLEMAVLNTAINARDAMPDGGELRITTALRQVGQDAELSPGEYVELSVIDTGTGMSPEVLARALDPFFTTKDVGKGTGLGLSQVYGIARQTGGTVRIESRIGQGTTVRILLPRTIERPEPGPDPETTPDAKSDGPQATVLVVDDDPDVRAMLVASLDALGYRVLEAQDGAAGLSMLRDSQPDLLLVDFAMPNMTGAEVARAVQAQRPGLPIVFMSGYSDSEAIEAAAGQEAVMLRKPFRIHDLQSVLDGALGR
ncbi:hybrid sensor histidine kinase/response regulator [Rubellimicrobium roseum]|uniref:histidine kinase n=1 Tax=Rubellimicrobium roseum TaxID=687525 RepID=A0A5C4N7V3_9RHOB|nr:PAS domain-containing hybrid sensor histidine kinase/response regulator [Rubellimicrobium roseum]TNC59690.1 PAS domain S-box protein [Rubellimicrobium roseum]